MIRFLILWAAYAAFAFGCMVIMQALTVKAPADIQATLTATWAIAAVVLGLPMAMAHHRPK